MMTKLDESKFKPLFGTWWEKIKPFFLSGGFDPIYEYLKKEAKRGKVIVPSSANTFRCFIETPIDDVMVVMCGISPYHTLRGTKIIADGLLMGCSLTGYMQPSLKIFYETIENEMYRGEYFVKNPDVRYLCKQGVLMFNASLTTEARKAGRHLSIWEPFIKYLFEDVLSVMGVPVIFLGKDAAELKKYLFWTHIFEISHPASAAYTNSDWATEGTFKLVNKFLEERHNTEIKWLDMPSPF